MEIRKESALIVAASLRIGGAEKVAADIGFYADPEKFTIHYVVFGDEVGAYEPELEARGCRIFHLPQPSESFCAYMKNLKKLIRTYHYDVIHAHTMFNIGWAMLAGRLYGVPVRVAHAHSALAEKRSVKVRLYEALMKSFILSCATDRVACGVSAGERLYGRRAFGKKGITILNGVDTRSFAYDADRRDAFRSQLGLRDRFVIGHAGHLAAVKNQAFLIDLMPEILVRRPDAFLIVSCGRLSPAKGMDLAVDACALLVRRGVTGFHWWIVGGGPEEAALRERAERLGVRDTVTLLGMRENPYPYIRQADLYVQPSRFEAYGLTIAEAMILNVPILSTDTDGARVLLTDGVSGALCAADAGSIADGVMRLIADPERRAGYVRYLKEHSPESENSAILEKLRGLF